MNSIVHRVLSRVRGRDITVDITQADINKGVRGSPTWCPGAQAIRRLFPDALEIRVSKVGVQILYVTHSLRWDAPATFSDWVSAFDKKGEGQPRSFRLSFAERIEHDAEKQAVLRKWYPVYP